MRERPKLKGLSSTFDIPDPDEPGGEVEELAPLRDTVVPASAWFATVWSAIVVGLLGVVALWVLAVVTVVR